VLLLLLLIVLLPLLQSHHGTIRTLSVDVDTGTSHCANSVVGN
jgi:hypothetical protein